MSRIQIIDFKGFEVVRLDGGSADYVQTMDNTVYSVNGGVFETPRHDMTSWCRWAVNPQRPAMRGEEEVIAYYTRMGRPPAPINYDTKRTRRRSCGSTTTEGRLDERMTSPVTDAR